LRIKEQETPLTLQEHDDGDDDDDDDKKEQNEIDKCNNIYQHMASGSSVA